jgi:hypothetical protein
VSIIKIKGALEAALDSMEGIIPAVAIATCDAGNPAVFNTVSPHNLMTGMSVRLTGVTLAGVVLDGDYDVVATGLSAFTLVHPVAQVPIASAAGGAGGVVRANLTAWEGVHFKPFAGAPYQRVNLLPATPENPSFGDSMVREIGIFQVTLYYPAGRGTGDVLARAQMIRSLFKRGAAFESGGVVVKILKTPAIVNGHPVDEYFAVPVIVNYQADVFQ